MTVHMIYQNFMNRDGTGMSVGGIQTYISNLASVAQQCGYKVCVYQLANQNFKTTINNIEVRGFYCAKRNFKKFLFKQCKQNFDVNNDILIFACESCLCKTGDIKSIAIQHGITWDKPKYVGPSKVRYFLEYIYQGIKDWLIIKRVEKANTLVCVDYNFVNWYRASVAYPKFKINVIPNFTHIVPKHIQKQEDDSTIKILFARRFFEYRGTRIFANVVERLLQHFSNLDITIAGSGPDEQWLKQKLGKFSNVHFITYESQDSLSVHSDKHIAIIPTIGSEGTSLSLLEAMSSQCAVVCTNVGGMTNIVIDQYNGRIINPEEEALYQAILELIKDRKLREFLSQKAYETVQNGFSFERWSAKWTDIFYSFTKLK